MTRPNGAPVADDSPTIEVEPIGEPTPPPWTDELAESESAEQEPAALALDQGEIARRLTTIIQTPFAAVAVVRGPHWRVTEDEAYPIALNLAAVLPRTWWVERALAASPWGAAGAGLVILVQQRIRIDQELAARAAEEAVPGGPPGRNDTRADRAAPAGPGRPGPRGVGAARDESVAVAGPDGWEGAGLGPLS